jgi:hypothetical protein
MQPKSNIMFLPLNVRLLSPQRLHLPLLILPLPPHLLRQNHTILRHQLCHLSNTPLDIRPPMCKIIKLCLQTCNEVVGLRFRGRHREGLCDIRRSFRGDRGGHADEDRRAWRLAYCFPLHAGFWTFCNFRTFAVQDRRGLLLRGEGLRWGRHWWMVEGFS